MAKKVLYSKRIEIMGKMRKVNYYDADVCWEFGCGCKYIGKRYMVSGTNIICFEHGEKIKYLITECKVCGVELKNGPKRTNRSLCSLHKKTLQRQREKIARNKQKQRARDKAKILKHQIKTKTFKKCSVLGCNNKVGKGLYFLCDFHHKCTASEITEHTIRYSH